MYLVKIQYTANRIYTHMYIKLDHLIYCVLISKGRALYSFSLVFGRPTIRDESLSVAINYKIHIH